MKIRKVLLLTGLMLSLLLSGCNYEAIVESAVRELAHQLTDPTDVVEPLIGFAETEVEEVDQLQKLTPEELENYTSRYSEYNSYTYFAHLNDSEKLLYRAYEYAMDQALPYFWIDDRLLLEMEHSTFQVLEFLSLDSAVVEQNICQSQAGYTVTHTLFNVETGSESYRCLFVENFSRENLKRKDEAIDQAKSYLEKMEHRETASQREIAEYIYDYIDESVSNVNNNTFEQKQADYNQNNSNAADYIKNRTHYDSREIVSTILEGAFATYLSLDSNLFLLSILFSRLAISFFIFSISSSVVSFPL